jgi:uncharacterized membrane-anchored protein YitT (DUF2179 family)
VRRIAVILFGSALFALGFDLFLAPNDINCGGVSGLAMVILRLNDFTTIGILCALINVPLFLLGLKAVGKKFFAGSLIGMAFSSWLIDLLEDVLPVFQTDVLISAIFGGVMIGAGLGMVFAAEASTGGSDILGRLLKRVMPNMPIGKLMLMLDIIVIGLTGVVFKDINNTLYSAVTLYVSSVVIDGVVYGMDYSKVVWIISDEYEQIAAAIDSVLQRGITMVQAQGFYARKDKSILLCAVKRRQVAELKSLVHEIDPQAFVILQDAHQVLGDGFKRYDKNDL